jgi:hypothetical protein
MSRLGSLPIFCPEPVTFSPGFRESRMKSSKETASPDPSVSKHRSVFADSTFQERFLKHFSMDNRTDFIYTSERKERETRRAAATKPVPRPVHKNSPKDSIPRSKLVTSRVSCRRDPNEIAVPIPKTVKLQEKIRNELL